MNRYKELLVWQKSIDLAVEVYQLTEKLQKRRNSG
nr:four helix bundle protein [Algoriphagus mannitolivorans]